MNGKNMKGPARAQTPEAGGEWQGLVRKLVLRVAPEPSRESASIEGQDEVLFDGNVDGVRCLLLRPRGPIPPPVVLSPREHEIARMVAKGLPNKTIASVLEISGWTVCSHLRRIFTKLGVNSRAAMVARILATGHLENKWVQHAAPIAQESVEASERQLSRHSAPIR